jgi:hypothetical protein
MGSILLAAYDKKSVHKLRPLSIYNLSKNCSIKSGTVFALSSIKRKFVLSNAYLVSK